VKVCFEREPPNWFQDESKSILLIHTRARARARAHTHTHTHTHTHKI